jgi:phosphate transport system permease protein
VLLLMVVGIVGIILVRGLETFWPRRLTRFEMTKASGGKVIVGEEIRREVRTVDADEHEEKQVFIRVANREIYGTGNDFRWLRADDIEKTTTPEDLVVFERMEHGPAFGRVRQVLLASEGDSTPPRVLAEGPQALAVLRDEIAAADRRRDERLAIQEGDLEDLNAERKELEDQARYLASSMEPTDSRFAPRKKGIDEKLAAIEEKSARLNEKVGAMLVEDERHQVVLEQGDGTPFRRPLPVSQILRADEVNAASWVGRVGLFFGRLWRFVSERPREANTDGGVWPAIFGTMLMTIIMTIFVVPFGVVAALYLREYAKQGPLIAAVRIAVNNLAGVPSIVFGVFGLGFFCYFVGGAIDRQFFAEHLPTPTFGGGGILWASLTLALLTVPVVIVATEEALAAVPRSLREAAIACGASKWQMIRRVVLPHASPGILTGAILAMARGAGEVAPLMLTGVIHSADALPIDGHAPYFHADRNFMHLGYMAYTSGFQSPNVDATTPLVYSITLVLLTLVLVLNLGAVLLRNRLRKKFRTGAF